MYYFILITKEVNKMKEIMVTNDPIIVPIPRPPIFKW